MANTKLIIGDNKGTNVQNIATTPTSNPNRPTATQLASTILTLDVANIKDGTKLEFDGKTYTFAVGDDSTVDKTGENVIDLTAYTSGKKNVGAVTDTDDKEKIMGIITSKLNSGSSNFSVGTDENGNTSKAGWSKVTVFERGDATKATSTSVADKDTQKLLETKKGFQSLFKLFDPDTAAGTEIKITDKSVKEGNTLSIDGTDTFRRA